MESVLRLIFLLNVVCGKLVLNIGTTSNWLMLELGSVVKCCWSWGSTTVFF